MTGVTMVGKATEAAGMMPGEEVREDTLWSANKAKNEKHSPQKEDCKIDRIVALGSWPPTVDWRVVFGRLYSVLGLVKVIRGVVLQVIVVVLCFTLGI